MNIGNPTAIFLIVISGGLTAFLIYFERKERIIARKFARYFGEIQYFPGYRVITDVIEGESKKTPSISWEIILKHNLPFVIMEKFRVGIVHGERPLGEGRVCPYGFSYQRRKVLDHPDGPRIVLVLLPNREYVGDDSWENVGG